VSIFEYNEEEELRKIRAVEYELGREEGEQRLTRLLQALLKDGREKELPRVSQERDYRIHLYEEYGI